MADGEQFVTRNILNYYFCISVTCTASDTFTRLYLQTSVEDKPHHYTGSKTVSLYEFFLKELQLNAHNL